MHPNTPRLTPNRPAHPMHNIPIPARCHSKTLWEHTLLETPHAMQTLARVQERDLQAGFLQIEFCKGIDLRLVEGVPVVDDADTGVGGELEGVVVEFVVGEGTDGVVGEEEVELEDHFGDCHLGDEGLDEGGFVGVGMEDGGILEAFFEALYG